MTANGVARGLAPKVAALGDPAPWTPAFCCPATEVQDPIA